MEPNVVSSVASQMTDKKLSVVRKYAVELLVLLLVLFCYGCISAYLGKSSAFQEYLIQQNGKQTEVISNNTKVVEENTKAIQRNNQLLERRIEQTEQQNIKNP